MNVELSSIPIAAVGPDDRSDSTRLAVAAAVRQILAASGEDPEREGLRETPLRVAKMYEELFSGLKDDACAHLLTQFTADRHESTVVVKDIVFYSVCEHHLVPFFGKAHVAYVPDEGRLTGLSKIARTVQSLARRPQLQERLTTQIVDAVWSTLRPKGALAIVEAEHLCMAMRGVRSPGSSTVTVVSKGTLETDAALRAETIGLLRP
jgi:GTP cyclohydrolase I